MIDSNIFTATPLNWDKEKSFLTLIKKEHETSYGAKISLYTVISRESLNQYTKEWNSSNSLKGVEYCEAELKNITIKNKVS